MKKTFLVIFIVSFFTRLSVGAPGNLIRTFKPPVSPAAFGYSVLAVGNNVLAGGPFVNIPGAPGDERFAGRAYLLDGLTGNIIHTFQGQAGGMFGFPTAIIGNKILISAEHDNTNAISSGAVYLFDSSTFNQLDQSPILNPTPQNYDTFGCSIAVLDNNIVIGAYSDDTSGTDAGAAYLYDISSGNLLRTFLNPSPSGGKNFGFAVAAFGSNILIGSPIAGVVYLFDSSNGVVLRTFLNPTPASGDGFGSSIATLNNIIVIGAKGDDAGASNAGIVYVFDGLTGNQLPQSPIRNPMPGIDDCFGEAVAFVSDNILIGARGDQSNIGAAYLFDSSTGKLLLTFLNPTPRSGDCFGYSVAAMENDILIGTPYDPEGGAIYLFEGYPNGDFEPDGDVDFSDFAFLANYWANSGLGSYGGADITGDGTVDINDLYVFAGNWLKGK